MATILKVVDEDGNDVPEGVVGRVFVGNDLLFEGYTRPGVDKENLRGLVSTGDLGSSRTACSTSQDAATT